jgi:hypothetical protein
VPAVHPVHAVQVFQWYRCVASTTRNEGSVGSTTAAALQYQQVIGTILRSFIYRERMAKMHYGQSTSLLRYCRPYEQQHSRHQQR